MLPDGVLPTPAVGTRLVFKMIFADTRAAVGEGGRGRWVDKPLGSVVVGGRGADVGDDAGDDAMNGNGDVKENLEGDADKTLADARFVIGDYIACTIYPPTVDGRVAPAPPPISAGRGPREPYVPPRGGGGLPPPPRENGYGPPRGSRGRGGGGFGAAPPPGDWRRGERPPSYGGGGGYRGRGGGRPY